MDNKQYQKQRYDWLKQSGLCVHCGQADARPGRTTCAECANLSRICYEKRKLAGRAAKNTPEYLRERYRNNRINGRCIACGLPLDGKGVRCIACARAHANRNNRYYYERKGLT